MDTIYDSIMKTVDDAYIDGAKRSKDQELPLSVADVFTKYGNQGSVFANNLIFYSYWIGYLVGRVFATTASLDDKYAQLWEGRKALIEAVNWGITNGYYDYRNQPGYDPDVKWQNPPTQLVDETDIAFQLIKAFYNAFDLGAELANVPFVEIPVGIPAPPVEEIPNPVTAESKSSTGWWMLGLLALAAVVTGTGYTLSSDKKPAEKHNPALRKFTSVGSYPMIYINRKHEVLCPTCAGEYDRILAEDVNWENPDLHCDECGERIESAYAESSWS
jgi:hypothetical protein